jgi:hypothetical protein
LDQDEEETLRTIIMVERVFEYYEVPESKRFKLVGIKLRG